MTAILSEKKLSHYLGFGAHPETQWSNRLSLEIDKLRVNDNVGE
jgi:hypothetical protein